MKRSPIKRKTPLARGHATLRRSPMRRTRARPSMDPVLHRHVVERDGCFLASIDPDHRCADAFGGPHGPRDYDRLTVDHVWPSLAEVEKGHRPPDSARTLVGMCHAGNVGAPSHAVRERERDHLARLAAEGRL